MKAVIKREFFSAFHRLTAYIAVAIQLFLSAVVISSNNLSYTLESTATAVSFMSLLSLIVIPVIAGEFIPFGKRAEADDVYGVLPLVDRQIALGKFFAAMSVVLIADSFLIFAPFLSGFFGTVDHLMSYTATLGLLLLQAVAVAFCLLVFRAVKNRILAYVTVYASVLVLMALSVFIVYFPVGTLPSLVGLLALCVLVGLCVWLFSRRLWLGGCVAVGLGAVSAIAYAVFPRGFAGLFAAVITGASPIDRFNRFLSGVLDFGSVLYFVSLIFFLLWCLCRSFALPHEPREKRPSMSLRKLTSAAVVLLLAAAVLTLNVAAAVVPSRMLSADATVTKKATPSDEALRFISGVEKDVELYILEPIDASLDNTMNYSSYRLYLERLVAANPRFSLTEVYGRVNPEFYSERGLSQDNVTPNSLIIQCGDRWQYVNYYGLLCFGNSDFSRSYMSVSEYEYWVAMIYNMYQSNPEYAQYWYSINQNTTSYRNADAAISVMVEYVTKDIIPTVYYLTGHGEVDVKSATSVFSKMGVTPLDTTGADIPLDAAGIVVNCPAEDFSEAERDAFLEYLSRGGQMTFLTNEENLDMPNLCAVLSAYGMSVENKAFVTRQQTVGEGEEQTAEPTTDIAATVNFNNDVLGELDSTSITGITLSNVNAITVRTDGLEYPTVTPLLESPSDCYLGDDAENKAGYILACAVETPNGARVVWFTGGESVGKAATGAESLVTEAVSWTTMQYTTATDGIKPTLYMQPMATVSSGGATAISVLLYLTSVGVAVFGVVELYRRKRAI